MKLPDGSLTYCTWTWIQSWTQWFLVEKLPKLQRGAEQAHYADERYAAAWFDLGGEG